MTPTPEQEKAALDTLTELIHYDTCEWPHPEDAPTWKAMEVLKAALIAARRDSVRYRFIKDELVDVTFYPCHNNPEWIVKTPSPKGDFDQHCSIDLDRAIDAAIAAAKGVA